MLSQETNQLCYGIVVTKIGNPTAAHVHNGRQVTNGPIAITLTTPNSVPGAASGCANLNPPTLQDILKHPRRYYVNVHTADVSDGALRGQL